MTIKLYEKNNSPRDLQKVVEVLNDGGIIILPTDTRYAIGCHAMKEHAIERICQIKGIDTKKNHLSIMGNDLSMLSEYVKLDNNVFKMVKRNIPGPFAFILNTSNRLPKIFKNRKEVGIRIPDNNIVQDICRLLEVPLMCTTLPIDAQEDTEYLTDPELIEEKWENKVDLIIDGGMGNTEGATIVNCTEGEYEITRQGKGILR